MTNNTNQPVIRSKKMIKLNFNVTTTPDFSGFLFYVEEGRFFDVDDYAEAYGINSDDIDKQDIRSAARCCWEIVFRRMARSVARSCRVSLIIRATSPRRLS